MEKFNRWSDLSTGVNPFVPARALHRGNVGVQLVQGVLGSLLVVLRVGLIGVLAIVFCATNLLGWIVGNLPLLGRAYLRFTESILCGLALIILGVRLRSEHADVRRLGLIVPGVKDRGASSRVRSGDLLVSNHSSFLDVLYLSMKYSPKYIITTEKDAAKGLVQTCGVLQALYYAATGAPISLSNPRKLQDVLAQANRPVAIFPEGIRSNNKAILKFLPVFGNLTVSDDSQKPFRCHLICIKYDGVGFVPAHTTRNAFWHLMSTCYYISHSMKVTHLDCRFVPAFPTRGTMGKKLTDDVGNVLPATPDQWAERLRTILATLLRSKPVDLSVSDFVSFNAYWNHVTGGGRQPASDFTQRKAPHEHAQWSK